MANRLKLAMLQALLALFQQRWSQRRIAKTPGIDRGPWLGTGEGGRQSQTQPLRTPA